MSFIPGEKLHYAETHFKFKLPWSLLYRPWPEILVDAPFQFVPGAKPVLWIVVRDAHRFPVELENVSLKIEKKEGCGASAERRATQAEAAPRTLDLQITADQQFGFYPVELGELEPGNYAVHCQVTARSLQSGKRKTFARWNYPFLKPTPLQFQVLAEQPPKPEGYIAGEMHCHTHYSADHVEHGASPAVLQQAARAVGLDFVCCTDHAYDFAFLTEDYTKAAPLPLPRFEALKKEVDRCNEDGGPLMIAGEEVSAGNSKGENVHMTVLGADCFLPGLGDCGRNWLNNRPTMKIAELLKMTKAHCFAAHPWQEMGALEKFIFRRGFWSSKDLQTDSAHPIRGLQFWNGIRDEGFKLGREMWIQELGKENYLLPIGGNDAHGDLNETTAVSLPLFKLKKSRHHIFGKVRTVVKIKDGASGDADSVAQSGASNIVGQNSASGIVAPSSAADGHGPSSAAGNITHSSAADSRGPSSARRLTQADAHLAFDGDNCYITDGPALWWQRVVDRGDPSVTFFARSNSSTGGAFRYIRIYGRRRLPNGKLAPKEELHLASQVAAREATDITVAFENFAYLRAECLTASGKFALTSAAVRR